jgi:hypothetical protein
MWKTPLPFMEGPSPEGSWRTSSSLAERRS